MHHLRCCSHMLREENERKKKLFSFILYMHRHVYSYRCLSTFKREFLSTWSISIDKFYISRLRNEFRDLVYHIRWCAHSSIIYTLDNNIQLSKASERWTRSAYSCSMQCVRGCCSQCNQMSRAQKFSQLLEHLEKCSESILFYDEIASVVQRIRTGEFLKIWIKL